MSQAASTPVTSSRIRSIRRSGSAAPHSSWSPTVKAARYSSAHRQLAQPADRHRQRAGDRRRRQLGERLLAPVRHHLHPVVAPRRACPRSRRAARRACSLMVSAWLWQRIAPTRTQMPSTGIGRCRRGRGSCWSRPAPFHSSRLWPLPRSLSIQGSRLPASGTPKCSVGKLAVAQRSSATARSMSRIAEAGSSSSALGADVPTCAHLLHQLAHVLRAGAGGRLVGHRGHPLDQVALEQPVHAHQHQAHGAVAADEVLARPLRARFSITGRLTGSRMMTASSFMRSARGGVDPVALPARRAQLRIDLVGVVAALAGDDHRQRLRAPSMSLASLTGAGVACRSPGPCRPPARWRRTPARCGRSRAPRACAAPAPSPPCRASRRFRLSSMIPCQFIGPPTTASPISAVPTFRVPAV